MRFTVNEDFTSTVKKDLKNKYLQSGKRLSGEIKGDKMVLFIEDDYGKHSAFMSQYFYGKISGDELNGSFRASNYIIILLGILFVFALESLIAAIVLKGFSGVILPSAIIVAVVLYFIYLKRLSAENNELIKNYLSSI